MTDPAVPITLSPTPADLWSVDERSLDLFAKQLDGPPAPRAWYELRREAEHVALVPGFDRLITLGGHAIKELPHQIDVAQRVLRQMGGRAILADEILRHHWDLVIVDEAHKIKSHRGATYQFIEKIERDFILLLTATPLQNDMR